MPLLTPEVPHGELTSCLDTGMPLVLRAYKEPAEQEDQVAEADTSSEKSEGDSGKENEDCVTSGVKWRGSKSSLASRGSRSSLTSRTSLASRGSRPRSGPFNQLNLINAVVIKTSNKQVKESEKKTVLCETIVQQQLQTAATRTTRTTRLQSKKQLLSSQEEVQQQQVLSSPGNGSISPEKAQPSNVSTATTTTAVVTNQSTVVSSNETEQVCADQLAVRSAQLTLTSPSSSGDGGMPVRRLQMFNSKEKLIINQTIESPRSPVKTGRSFAPQSPMSPHKIQMPERRISMTDKLKHAISSSPKAFSTKSVQKRTTQQQRTTITAKPSKKATKLAQAAEGSRSITEFFTIRRSERKKKSEMDLEWMESIEARLLATEDTDLGLAVEDITGKGRGVVARKPFQKGDFVVEYAGELIDLVAAKEKESEYSQDITKGCYMYYFNHRDKQYCIDATKETGRYGRLLNHSCKTPNCVTKVVMLPEQEVPRLILVAKQDIEEGTELLYDYGDRSKESLKAHPWLLL
jgi:histone-lysine N-methyltransferase SETD8